MMIDLVSIIIGVIIGLIILYVIPRFMNWLDKVL